MKRRTYLRSILLVLVLPAVLGAQSRVYAKYDPKGEPVGFYNLFKDAGGCGSSYTFDGIVLALNSWKHGSDIEYRFVVKVPGGQRQLRFVLGVDDIPVRDVRSLIRHGRAVKVRACRTGRIWTVEEITRRSFAVDHGDKQ